MLCGSVRHFRTGRLFYRFLYRGGVDTEWKHKGIVTPKSIVVINDKKSGAFGAYDNVTDIIYLNEKIVSKETLKNKKH